MGVLQLTRYQCLAVLSFCFAVCMHTVQAKTPDDAQVINLINSHWQYLEQNHTQVDAALKATDWQAITLPHSWNTKDTMDTVPGFRRNASWYKRNLTIQPQDSSRYMLYFEGANMQTKVYLNNQFVGEHIGGYIGFEMELTPYLNKSGDNTLMVRVTNEYEPNLIPSQKADFFIYGGIPRDVWLKKVPQTYMQKVHIHTPSVSHDNANTHIDVILNSQQKGAHTLTAELLSPNKKVLQTKTFELASFTGNKKVNIPFEQVNKPKLWSPDTPHLYSVKVHMRNAHGDVVQTLSDRFGYRWFEMRPYKGFFVNGERMLIRGTHRHEEFGGMANALSNQMHRDDMALIKEMGANFVRLGHYPQDPEVYRAADELGLVLWDELPWCRGGKGGSEWEKNTEYLLNTQIHQNYNHPSIAFWSLGNEMYWEEDFPGGGSDENVKPYLQKLHNMAKSLDPTRMTTIRKYYPGADVVDAFSPSIWAGWYGGAYEQYEEAIDHAMKQYPAFLHMEYGGSSHVGRHTETPIGQSGIAGGQVSVAEAVNQAVVKSVAKDSDWNSTYMVDLFDWYLNVSETKPNFAGNAQWSIRDFGTPLRPENPIPYVNQKGLFTRTGEKKDAYYVFASRWSTTPFCWIESHTWTHRYGPKEGRDVSVFCNTPKAELFLNGKSLGVKNRVLNQFPANGLVWKVPFKEGENRLKAVGFIEGENKTVDNALNVTYVLGEPQKFAKMVLTQTALPNNKVMIHAEAQDKNGNRVTDYAERMYFQNLSETGKLFEHYGSVGYSSTIEMGNGYTEIMFERGDKNATIELKSQNIKGAYIVVKAQ